MKIFLKQVFFIFSYAVLFYLIYGCSESSPAKDTQNEEITPEIAIDTEIEPQIDVPVEQPQEEPLEISEITEIFDVPAEVDVRPDVPPDGPPPAGNVGDACSTPEDCSGIPAANKQCLTQIGSFVTFEGGYCSASCTSDPECGTDGKCVNIILASYCLKACDSPTDCRTTENYTCGELPSFLGIPGTFCLPAINMGDAG